MSYSTVAIQFIRLPRLNEGTYQSFQKDCSLCSVRQQLLSVRRNYTSVDEDEFGGYLRTGLTGPRPIEGKVEFSWA